MTKPKTTAREVLFALSDWGWGDIDFVCETADDFNVDMKEIDFEDRFEAPQLLLLTLDGLNDVIAAIFEQALFNIDPEWIAYSHKVNINANSVASSFYFNGEYISDADDLRDAVEKFKQELSDENI